MFNGNKRTLLILACGVVLGEGAMPATSEAGPVLDWLLHRGPVQTAGYAPYSTPSCVTDEEGRCELEHVRPGRVFLAAGDEKRQIRLWHGEAAEVSWTMD